MRKLVLKLHMYAGLLCSGYLIILGLSSLNFQHRFGFATPGAEKRVWERTIAIKDLKNRWALASAVRDSMGVIGWPNLGGPNPAQSDGFRFRLSRPGKHYTVTAGLHSGVVRVEEQQTGIWAVMGSLHGLREVPGSRFMDLWGAYTQVCPLLLLFALGSGVTLWTARRSERIAGWVLWPAPADRSF